VEIKSLCCQIQGNKTEGYQMFIQMQTDYHKIESNLKLAIAEAQQHMADATGAYFNLTITQFAEVTTAHIALRIYIEIITISTAENEE
jgi:hypothetical protein